MANHKIKVLMFGWEFPPYNSGGLGTACLGLSKALTTGEGVKLTFVLPKKIGKDSPKDGLVFADSFLPDLSVHKIDSLLSPYITSNIYDKIRKEIGGDFYGSDLIQEVYNYALRARELSKTVDFDVIHAHDWLSFGAGIEAKHESHKPLVVHVHATEFDRTGGTGVNQTVYNLEKKGMEEADQVVTVSDYTRRIVIDKYGIMPEKVSVVHNGIDECLSDVSGDEIHLNDLKKKGKKIVLFVGRITLQKGPDYFLRMAALVLKHYPDVYFVVAGSGDMYPQIVRQSSELGIADKIIFAGFLRDKELDAVYKAADLYVMPSVSEPFGLTALEAAQHGTPVLVSKQSGVSEVINHAIKVDFWDIEEMANKVVSVLYHDSLREVMRKNAWSEISSVTWGQAAKKCVEIYKNLISHFKLQ